MPVFLALALAGVLLAPSHPRTVAPSHPRTLAPLLAVVAWNVAAGRGDIARVMEAVKAGVGPGIQHPRDIVLLLQEAVDPPPVTVSSFMAPVRQIDGRTMGTAILSTLPLSAPRVIALPRQRQPRAAAAATITVDGQSLLIISVHLENRGPGLWGGFLSEDARGRQADALLDAVPEGVHGIIGGDLNTWLGPTEPAWRKLVKRFPDLPPTRREVTFRNRLVLDHVLFDLPEGWTAERHVLPERYGSDHHPVVGLIWN